MKKVIRLTESELVSLVKKILYEQSLDLNIEQEGNYVKINNFTFRVEVKLPFGDFQPIKILSLKPKLDKTGYDIKVVDPREKDKLKQINLEIDNDTITEKIKPNLKNSEILIPGLVVDKKLIKIK